MALGLQCLKGPGLPAGGGRVAGPVCEWGRGGDNGAQHLLLAGRRDPPVKSQGEQGSVGGIDEEKGGAKETQPGGREEKGEGRVGGRRGSRLSFLPVTWSGAAASLALFPAETWGAHGDSRFSLPLQCFSQSKGQAPSRCSTLSWAKETCGPSLLWELFPFLFPASLWRRRQSRFLGTRPGAP